MKLQNLNLSTKQNSLKYKGPTQSVIQHYYTLSHNVIRLHVYYCIVHVRPHTSLSLSIDGVQGPPGKNENREADVGGELSQETRRHTDDTGERTEREPQERARHGD